MPARHPAGPPSTRTSTATPRGRTIDDEPGSQLPPVGERLSLRWIECARTVRSSHQSHRARCDAKFFHEPTQRRDVLRGHGAREHARAEIERRRNSTELMRHGPQGRAAPVPWLRRRSDSGLLCVAHWPRRTSQLSLMVSSLEKRSRYGVTPIGEQRPCGKMFIDFVQREKRCRNQPCQRHRQRRPWKLRISGSSSSTTTRSFVRVSRRS